MPVGPVFCRWHTGRGSFSPCHAAALCYLLLQSVVLGCCGWQAFTSAGLYFWWLRQGTSSSCVSESLTATLGKFQFTDLWKSSNFAVCGPPCVSPYQLCYGSIRSVEELFEALLVSGKSSPHHRRYSRQNEEGSGSRLRLDKCLLISAEMPGCFLISIPQHTAVVHLLIIQEEGCGYLMLCFRAFFSVHFPCSAFIPLCSFVSPSCCILYCAARHSHLRFAFFKKKDRTFAQWLRSQKSTRLCVCAPFSCFRWFYSVEQQEQDPMYSHSSTSALLIVCGTNRSYLDPAGIQHSAPKIKSSNCDPLKDLITLFKSYILPPLKTV